MSKKSLKKFKKQLTPEFLTTLKDAALLCGWSVDFYETSKFVQWCYEEAGKEIILSDLFSELDNL